MEDSCNAVLIEDFDSKTVSKANALHFLNIIDEATYNERRKGGAADADFPVEGVPVSFGATYQEFEQNRRNYFQLQGASLNYESSLQIVRKAVKPQAIEAWRDCMRDRGPFRVKVVSEDANGAQLKFQWNPPAQVGDLPVTSSYLKGGTSSASNTPGKVFDDGSIFVTGASKTVYLTRIAGAKMNFGVDLSGYACDGTSEGGPAKLETIDYRAVRNLSNPAMKNQHITVFFDRKSSGKIVIRSNFLVKQPGQPASAEMKVKVEGRDFKVDPPEIKKKDDIGNDTIKFERDFEVDTGDVWQVYVSIQNEKNVMQNLLDIEVLGN